MANTLSFNQISTVLNSIVQQATGRVGLTPTNTSEFVAVAQTALLTGYDPLLNAISQVLSKTIFSIRPYERKFGGIEVDAVKWGNHVRKLNIVDKDFEDDGRLPLTDGASVDMYKVNKPQILQTNFYGAQMFEKSYTIFRDQLDSAFTTPDEFARFITMVVQNCNDLIEQAHENLARECVANFIAGKISVDPDNVIHLLTEYNTATGNKYTATTILAPETYPAFVKWVYARVASLSSMLTERSIKYHVNVTTSPVSRHTPYSRQKMYLFNQNRYEIEMQALADIFHDNYLRMAYTETVNYWQSIDSPNAISITPTYMQTNGTLKTAESPVQQQNVFGVIFDEEAIGYTSVNQWSAPTPFNAKGGYSNVFFHFTDRYWNDFTENGIVLLMD